MNQVSLSFENLKRAAGQMGSLDGNSNQALNIASAEKSSGYSFFPPKRRARHAMVVSSVLPEIPIVAAPPIAETHDAFSWADFPQSSPHFCPMESFSNPLSQHDNARTY